MRDIQFALEPTETGREKVSLWLIENKGKLDERREMVCDAIASPFYANLFLTACQAFGSSFWKNEPVKNSGI
jgi:hypothetical protein